MRSKAAEIAAKLAVPRSYVKPEAKRRKLAPEQNLRGNVELGWVDAVGDSLPAVPPPVLIDVVILDEPSLSNQTEESQVVETTPRANQAIDTPAPAPISEPTQRKGKEAARATRAAGIATSEGGFSLPFRHRLTELSEGGWEQVRAALIGDTSPIESHREVVPEGERFVGKRPLDKESSVLESGLAQIRAMEQFLLPKDEELLRELPSAGLHLALKSYFMRGALLEYEMFSQLSHAHKLPADFDYKLAKERRAKEAAERRVMALEAEVRQSDGKWCRELEIKEDMLKGLQTHRAKQSASIEKLKGEAVKLQEDIDHLNGELAERDARIKYLGEEVGLERRHRLEAQEYARSERLAANHLRLDLEEEQVAHKETQAAVQALEARVASLDSEAFKAKVIEDYRHGALGKVEVALACKAGFDYLASSLPPGSRPIADTDYQPRVSVCLDFFREIETAGGGVPLEVDEGEDNEPGDEEEEVAIADPPATLPAQPPVSSPNLPSPTPDPSRGE